MRSHRNAERDTGTNSSAPDLLFRITRLLFPGAFAAITLLTGTPPALAQVSPWTAGRTGNGSAPVEAFGAASEERFWHWFAQHAKELYEAQDPSDPVVASLQEEIARVHPLLVGVLDGIRQDGRRIFIISAGGRREGFGAVRELARATPRFNRWQVFMYVPGRIRLRDYTAGEVSVRSDEVRAFFYRGEPDGMIRIQLLIPGYRPDRDAVYRQIAWHLLYDAIGEYELATRVESILIDSAESPYYREAIPYRSMPTRFNEYWYAIRRPR